MQKNKFFLIAALLVPIFFYLSEFSSGKTDNVTEANINIPHLKNANIVYLSDWKEADARNEITNSLLSAAIKNYEEKYKGKITFVYYPYDEKQSKLSIMLAAGNPPDVYETIAGFPQFSVNGYAQPIDDLINLKDPIWKDVKDAYDATEWKGQHNFVVINKGPLDVVWYNKTLFQKAKLTTPYDLYKQGKWDWNSFRDLAIKLTHNIDGATVIDQWGMSTSPESIIATTGNDLVKINGKAGTIENNLKNPDIISALNFFQECGAAKYNIIQPDLNGFMTDFAKGKIAMTIGAAWADTVWWKDMMMNGECSFVPAPRYPSINDYYVGGSADLWIIPKGAKNTEGAAAFLTELRKTQIDSSMQKVLDNSNIKNRGWTKQEIEMNSELQKLKYTYTFFPGVGALGDARWGFWHNLLVGGTQVESEIEQNYKLWNNEIDIFTGKLNLQHNEISASAGTPKIDGEIDDVWKNAEEIVTDQEKTTPDIATAKVKLLYDANTLYVLALVNDKNIMSNNKNPWECDSLEIYVDEDNSEASSYGNNTIQLRIGADGKMTGAGPAWDNRESSLTSAVKRIAGGYIIEASYKFNAVKGKPGLSIGFNVQVNDEESFGNRKGTSIWNSDNGCSYINPSRFGKVNFK